MAVGIEESRKAVAQVAQRALAQRVGRSEKVVPPSLVEAIAFGRGDRNEIVKGAREAFGTDKPLDLVLFDTDRIASYVFESSRPPVITGASTLLRELNELIARREYRDFVIFSGGGEGLLLVPAGRGEEICRAIEGLYAAKTANALSVTTGFLPVGPRDFVASSEEEEPAGGARLVAGTQAVLSRLRDQVRRQKEARGPGPDQVPGGDDRCVSCRDRRAGQTSIRHFRPDAPQDGALCDPCALRWKVGKEEIRGISFEELIAAVDGGEKAKYIGFLYVDGNSMGALFGDLSSLAEIRFLSQAVHAVFESVRSRVRSAVQAFAPGSDDRDLPMVSYLGGGDEAIWILPAQLAVQVAVSLPEWMAEASAAVSDLPPLLQKKTGSPHITYGAGLVLCAYSYPVRYQLSLAKQLQKSAKSMFYRDPAAPAASSIDFEVLTESSPLSESLEAARALTDRTEDPRFRRSCRPYTAAGFVELVQKMRRLRDDDVNVATSQLYALQDGSREGWRVFLNFLRYQIARKPAGPKYQRWLRAFGTDPADPAAIERFFIQDLAGSRGTWIADGLQLARFMGWRED